MKSASFSYPAPEVVLADIGEKGVRAFTLSIQRSRSDLRDYRSLRPQWVADHSERGLANWIHDRIWAHLVGLAEDVSSMTVTESGPLREITIGLNYRIRVKRHDEDGNIASYPTQGFLEFVFQPVQRLPGMEETRLCAGYEWIKDQRDIGDPVLTLRDGTDNQIWKEFLPEIEDDESGTAPVPVPEQPQPTGPTVDIPEGIGRKSEEPAEAE